MKMITTIVVVVLLLVTVMFKGSAFAGEPVPGAEIYIELEPDNEPFANVVTDSNGEFSFSVPKWGKDAKIPASATFTFLIKKAPKGYTPLTNKIKTTVKTKGKSVFTFILTYTPASSKTQNRGTFAVSGKSSS